MNLFGIIGLIVWVLVFVVSAYICIQSERPGHRRRKHDQQYAGPERRHDTTECDVYDQPVFVRTCPVCGSKMHPSAHQHKEEDDNHV